MRDVIVIGGGAGGVAAAIRATQLGGKVTLIEKDLIGGSCLNRGCIPTKTLLTTARLLFALERAEELGIAAEKVGVLLERLQARRDEVVENLRLGTESTLASYGIQILRGEARLLSPTRVEVDGQVIEGHNIIIATGSSPVRPDFPGADAEIVWGSDDALAVREIPGKLLVVGGGPVELEFAWLYRALGSKVTVAVEERLLPGEDHEVGQRLGTALREQGIEVLPRAKLAAVEEREGRWVAVLETRKGEKTLDVDRVLVARRRPAVDELGLERIGVRRREDGGIVVNERMETSVPGVYAIGDATGGPFFSNRAEAQGIAAGENAMGGSRRVREKAIPRCTYTWPEVACVGLTEAQAEEKGYDVKTSVVPLSINARAMTLGEEWGSIKIVSEARYNAILGLHIVGPFATELIGEAALAIELEATADELALSVRPHPTISECRVEAARALLGQALFVPEL